MHRYFLQLGACRHFHQHIRQIEGTLPHRSYHLVPWPFPQARLEQDRPYTHLAHLQLVPQGSLRSIRSRKDRSRHIRHRNRHIQVHRSLHGSGECADPSSLGWLRWRWPR